MNNDLLAYLALFAKAVPVSFVALMPVINPIGTAIILLGLTSGLNEASRKAVAKKIAANTAALLAVVVLGGSYLLTFFGISLPIVQLAGGLVLASMGWNLLNQTDPPADKKQRASDPNEDESSVEAKSFYPFTFPVTVGPGGIAVALTLSAHTAHDTLADTAAVQLGALAGIIGVALVVYFCFAYSHRVVARLGSSGTLVMMRLIAFVVVCIGAEISWTGLRTLLAALPR